MSMKQRKLGAL